MPARMRWFPRGVKRVGALSSWTEHVAISRPPASSSRKWARNGFRNAREMARRRGFEFEVGFESLWRTEGHEENRTLTPSFVMGHHRPF